MAKNGDEINLRRLINIGKDKGYITYQELNEDLSDDVISSEEIDDLLQMFEDLNIKVVSEPVAGQIEKSKKTEKAEGEAKEGKSSLSEIEEDFTTKTYDPVKMYLREMGLISLLSREGEVEIAKRIESGENQALNALIRCRVGIEYMAELGGELEAGEIKVRDIVNDIEDESVSISELKDLVEKLDDIDASISKERNAFLEKAKEILDDRQYVKLVIFNDKLKKDLFNRFSARRIQETGTGDPKLYGTFDVGDISRYGVEKKGLEEILKKLEEQQKKIEMRQKEIQKLLNKR